MKYKIFISQPMNNKSNRDIELERKELVKELKKQGFEVLDTILDLGKNATSLHYLAKSIEIMAEADIVLFMQGWENARGCLIEYQIAKCYGKEILILGGF